MDVLEFPYDHLLDMPVRVAAGLPLAKTILHEPRIDEQMENTLVSCTLSSFVSVSSSIHFHSRDRSLHINRTRGSTLVVVVLPIRIQRCDCLIKPAAQVLFVHDNARLSRKSIRCWLPT